MRSDLTACPLRAFRVAQRVRVSSDQIYGIARFFAWGGSYHNFYMLTGGNNYERKAGGVVTTAYAPDTVIDNLLLRHEPRFSFYQSFFLTMQAFAEDLLSTGPAPAIPLNATVVGDRSVPAAPTPPDDPSDVSLTTCYQYPDPHQHWTAAGGYPDSFSLSPGSDPTKCLEVSGLATKAEAAVLAKCDGGSDQLWSAKDGQITTIGKHNCARPWLKGEMCFKCLDAGGGSGIDVWDCKSPSPKNASNQQFEFDAKTTTITYKGQCVAEGGPAPPPLTGTGAEAQVYGALAFVTNYRENQTLDVTFEGRQYHMPAETIVMVNRSQSGRVVWNSTGHFDELETKLERRATGEQPKAPQEIKLENWGWTQEPVGYGKFRSGPAFSPEQLNITDNDSDYLWYSFSTTATGAVTVATLGGDDSKSARHACFGW